MHARFPNARSALARTLVRSLILLALLPHARAGSPGADELVRRLDEAWRWRELWDARRDGRVQALTLDPQGRPLILVEGAVWRHDGGWSCLEQDPLDAAATAARRGPRLGALAACGEGWIVLDERGFHFGAPARSRRTLPLAPAHAEGQRLLELGQGLAGLRVDDALVVHEGERELRRIALAREVAISSAGLDARGRVVLTCSHGVLRERGGAFERLREPPQVAKGGRFGPLLRCADGLWILPNRLGGEPFSVRLRGEELELGPPTPYLWDALLPSTTRAAEPRLPRVDEALALGARGADLVLLDADGTREERELPEALGGVERLVRARGGRVVLRNTRGSLWLLDLGSERWSRVLGADRRARGTMLALAPARAGGVWVGADEGLVRVDERGPQEQLGEAAGVALRNVTAVHESAEGVLWVGSGGEFRGALRREHGRWERVLEPLGDACVHALVESPDGALWFLLLAPIVAGEDPGRGGGVARLDARGWTRWTQADGLPHGRCYSLAVDAAGRVLVGTYEGVARLEGERWVALPETAGRPARALLVARDGTLWVAAGTHERGLRAYRALEARDPAGPAGARGAERSELPLPAELHELPIGALAEDPDGSLWLSSKAGLFHWDGEHLHAPAQEAGAPAREFWPLLVRADARGQRELLLGSLGDGLLRFRPDDHEPPRFRDLGASVVDSAGLVHVHARAEDAWGSSAPQALRYLWRLRGEPWSAPVERAELELDLPRLPPGRGALEVRALDRAGNASSARTLAFEIPLPWHRRPLALIGLASLAAALAAVLVLVARQRALRRALERRERERLAASEWRFRSLVERAEVLFASAERDGRLSYLSPRLAGLLGGDAPPASVSELLERAGGSGASAASGTRVADALAGRASASAFELCVGAEGARRWLWAVVSPRLDAQGRPEGLDLAAIDVTERRRAEGEREERERWRRQVHRLETVGRLAAGVAHDFNNVLTAVLGHADLARLQLEARGGPRDPALTHLEQIQRSARRAAGLVRQLVAFSRQQRLEPVSADLSELVRGLAGGLRRSLREEIALELRLAPGLGPVRIDPAVLEQILWQLVSNAQDALAGAGTLVVSTEGLSLEGRAHVCLGVSDDGQGMDGETLQRAFDPFFTTKEVGRGSGLGLAAVHGLVRQSGGSIRARSEPGRGTTVELLFPCAPPDELDAPADGSDLVRELGAWEDVRADGALGLAAFDEERAERGASVLVVEDDECVREYATETLEREGHRVRAAREAEQALAWCAAGFTPELLVTDLVLPGLHGGELARRLSELRPGLPVLFLSGWSEDELGRLPPEPDLLLKPFEGAELAARVRRALRRGAVRAR